MSALPEKAPPRQRSPRPTHRFALVAFVLVGLGAVVLSRVGFVAYFTTAPEGDGLGHLRIGVAALLAAWTPTAAMLVLAPVAVVRAARDRPTWWLPLVALGVAAVGELAAAVLLSAA